LKPESGDSLNFSLPVSPARSGAPAAPPVTAEVGPDYRKAAAPAPLVSTSWLLALAGVIALLLAAVAVRTRAPAISAEQRDQLVLRIRRQLSLMDGAGDARS
ncbi:MAG TPA: hypothetical protein VEA60_14170, partial [Allosphingosinicella sp.]|nr:hypothetical protein [Allosphingosinicella sp.]